MRPIALPDELRDTPAAVGEILAVGTLVRRAACGLPCDALAAEIRFSFDHLERMRNQNA